MNKEKPTKSRQEEQLITYIDIPYFRNNPTYIERWRNYYNSYRDPLILLLMYHKQISTYYHWIYIELSRYFLSKNEPQIAEFVLNEALRLNVYDSAKIKEEQTRIPSFKKKYTKGDMIAILNKKNIKALGRVWNEYKEVLFYREEELKEPNFDIQFIKKYESGDATDYALSDKLIEKHSACDTLPILARFVPRTIFEPHQERIAEHRVSIPSSQICLESNAVQHEACRAQTPETFVATEKASMSQNGDDGSQTSHFSIVNNTKEPCTYNELKDKEDVYTGSKRLPDCGEIRGSSLTETAEFKENIGNYTCSYYNLEERAAESKNFSSSTTNHTSNDDEIQTSSQKISNDSRKDDSQENQNDYCGYKSISEDSSENKTHTELTKSQEVVACDNFTLDMLKAEIQSGFKNSYDFSIQSSSLIISQQSIEDDILGTPKKLKCSSFANTIPISGDLCKGNDIVIDQYIYVVQSVHKDSYVVMKIANASDVSSTVVGKSYILIRCPEYNLHIVEKAMECQFCAHDNTLFALIDFEPVSSLRDIFSQASVSVKLFYLEKIIAKVLYFLSFGIVISDVFGFLIDQNFNICPDNLEFIDASNKDQTNLELKALTDIVDVEISQEFLDKIRVLIKEPEHRRQILRHKTDILTSL